MTLEPIRYARGKLSVLDQLLLPAESKYIEVVAVVDGWSCIHNMNVRGAPAIALVGCLSVAVELTKMTFTSKGQLADHVIERLQYLVTARPTAVNMKRAADDVKQFINELLAQNDVTSEQMLERVLSFIEAMLDKDVADNMAIGAHGALHIEQAAVNNPIRILTHCNTGSLATAKYGTALGVIRKLWSNGTLDHAYCTETRPYNQGARLTAYELVYERIPATLICDDMAAWLMKNKGISAVIVGADRVVANGDTANKIGTYQLAILAKFHEIPFYVAAPTTTIDLNLEDGAAITIEERPEKEVTHIQGIHIAAPGIRCWNPAFDVTPAALITGGIVTEFGVFPSNSLRENLSKLKSGS